MFLKVSVRHFFQIILFCLLLPSCGGGGGNNNATLPNDSAVATPVNPDTLRYVRHSLVQDSVNVTLPYWESPQSGSAGYPVLEPEIEPLDISKGKWRALFLVIGTESNDESFIREIRNVNLLSSHDIVIDGYPAHQYVYEGNPHQDIYKRVSIIDVEDDSELDGSMWIPDTFRFLHTTVEVGQKFYTLLYAADANYFTRYETVAYSLAETMRFGLLLPLQSSQISGHVATASSGNQTLFAYCELESGNTLSLKTVGLASGRIITPPVTLDTFPSGTSACSATSLTFDGAGYLLAYATRSGSGDTLYARFLNSQGEAVDQGKSLDAVNVFEDTSTLSNLKAVYTGERYFLTWLRHKASNGEAHSLEGLLLDNNYNTSDLQSYATDLVVTDDQESQRLEIAHSGDTIALVWNFPKAGDPSSSNTQLSLLNTDGQQFASAPIVVQSSSDAGLRDPAVAIIGSTVTVFWVERRTAIDGSGKYDDQILGRQYSLLGESLQSVPTKILGPKSEKGIRYEKYKLRAITYADTFYILWDSNRAVSDLYSFAVNMDLTLRSNSSLITNVSSGTQQLLVFHHDSESYVGWLPRISSNFLQLRPFSRDELTAGSWLITESAEP
ncbi:hypothetical protein [Zhongshania sp. BJYM1]|uniref:hypothetical protein n=1 Tax=Zhongshania aquatica TaxID=2965069 RepID=UPI0022B4E086|nr:hypothetical protein [Marortus sp. BJYM1]